MMRLLFIVLLTLLSNSTIEGQQNILSTYTKIYIDSTEHIAKDDYLNNPVYFQKQYLNKTQKERLTKAIIKFSVDTSNYTLGNLYFTSDLIIDSSINSTIDHKKYYTLLHPYLDDSLVNDTLFVTSEIELMDKDGEYVYDELGDQLFQTTILSLHLREVLLAINQFEYWKYENKTFSKNAILNNIEYKVPESSYQFNWKRSLSNFKVNQESDYTETTPLLKNIEYEYYFFDVNKIIDKKTYWENKNELQDQIAILASENYKLRQTHLSQYYSLSNYIIADVFNNKLTVLDTNNKNISNSDLKNLFRYDTYQYSLDENDELQYDELGDQIFLGVSTFYKIEDIVGITFDENWYLSTNQFDIVKKVNSISFIAMHYDALENKYKKQRLPFKVIFNETK